MYEGEDENHPEDGEDAVGGVAPVEDGVDVGLVRHVGPPALDVGQVGHDVDQAEQLDVVEVETAPRPAGGGEGDVSYNVGGGHLFEMNTSKILMREMRM